MPMLGDVVWGEVEVTPLAIDTLVSMTPEYL